MKLAAFRKAIGVAVIVCGALIVTASPAAAATYDNVNPEGSACQNTATTVRSAVPHNNIGDHAGLVELRYSTACRTVWARVTGGKGDRDHADPHAKIHRNSDGKTLENTSANRATHCNSLRTVCWTSMLNDAGVTSYAWGGIDVLVFLQAQTSSF